MTDSDESLAFRANLNGHLDVSLTLQREVSARTLEALADGDCRAVASIDSERDRIRHAIEAGIGGVLPVLADVPTHVVGSLAQPGFTIDRLSYESAPGTTVTASLYRPDRPNGGAVLVACGHADPAKADPQYQRVARRLALAGITVLVPDPIGQGERHSHVRADGSSSVAWGTAEHTVAGVRSWWNGRSLARYLLRDAMAGLRLLATLPEVDPASLGVTGNSGGGYLTALLGVLDDRVAALAPGTFLCGRAAYLHSGARQDAEQHLLGGTVRHIDHADLLLGASPRPTLVLAAEYDFFPFEGTLAMLGRVNGLLEDHGAPPVELASSPTTHRYDDRLADAATRFFARHLGGESVPRPAEESALTPLSTVDLQVTRSGQIRLDDRLGRRVADEEAAAEPIDDGVDAVSWLRTTVETPRIPAAPFPRWFPPVTTGSLTVRQGFWTTERGVIVAGLSVLSGRVADGADIDTVTVVLGEGTDTMHARHPALVALEARAAEEPGHVLLVLDPRASGAVAPHDREGRDPLDIDSAVFRIACDLLWLDDSLQAGRVRDVLRTVSLVREGLLPGIAPTRVRLAARGVDAFTAALAAVLDPAIESVELDSVPHPDLSADHDTGHIDGGLWQRVIPGYARRFDVGTLPQLLGARLRITADDQAGSAASSSTGG